MPLSPENIREARRIIRTAATETIRRNPGIWADLKEQMGAGYPVAVYGSGIHLQFSAAAGKIVAGLAEVERAQLRDFHESPPDGTKTPQVTDAIVDEIFTRAARVASRW